LARVIVICAFIPALGNGYFSSTPEGSVRERMNKRRAVGIVDATRFWFDRRLAELVIVVGAAVCLLAHVSSGRQVNQESIKRKTVISEALMVDSSVAGIGAILGVDPANNTGITFFNVSNSNSLHIGVQGNASPYVSLKNARSNAGIDISIVPPGRASIQLRNRVPRAELDLEIHDDGRPMASLGDAHGVRLQFFGSVQKGEPVGFGVNDETGTGVMQITSGDKLTKISIFDSRRHLRTIMGLLAGKGPGFLWYDRALNPLLEMTEDSDGRPKINVNDPVARESRTFK
jgi:hypothetical protein